MVDYHRSAAGWLYCRKYGSNNSVIEGSPYGPVSELHSSFLH